MSDVNSAAHDKQTALVTGASSGIGRACCERLAGNGWQVVGASRTALPTTPWKQLTVDVREDGSIDRAVAEVLRARGRLDALVHCAGISYAGSVEDLGIDEAKAQFETNYFGSVRAIRAVLPSMREARAGRIVIVGSIGGRMGLPFLGHYSATKFALDGLIEALRLEIAPFGIQASILHPGDIRTRIIEHETRGRSTGASSPYSAAFEAVTRIYKQNVDNGPMPDKVAKAVETVLTQAHPNVSKFVGSPAEILAIALKGRLPSRMFEYILRTTYRM